MAYFKSTRSILAAMLVLFAFLLIGFGLWIYLTPEANKGKISGAYKALNLWSEQRAYPNQHIPDAAHYAGYVAAKKNIAKSRVAVNVDDWEEMGPHNLGGRTLAVAFNPENPNTIYAGSASGGLWRSYSAGRGPDAWDYVPTGFPVLGVSSIAFAPGDSNTIYIGTGEVYSYQGVGTGAAYRSTRGTYGIGILKSTDGGQTWAKSLDWTYNQQRGIWQVKVNPQNPNTVWASTTEGTYKSTDAGQTWTNVHNVIMGMDLVIHPADTNIVIASYGNFSSNGNGIYRTANGGATWSKITQGVPIQFNGKPMLSISVSNPDIVYASFGNGFGFADGASWLCRSNDAGATWSIQSTVDYSRWQGWFAHDVAVNPANPDEVTVIGIDIFQSTNGGSVLSQRSNGGWFTGRIPPEGPEGPPSYSHSDHHDVQYHPTNPNIIYFANDGGINRSIDGGATFESCNGGYQTAQFYNGFTSAQTDSSLSMGGLQDNSTAIYDGELSWLVHLIGGDGAWTGIDASDPSIMYGSWQGLNIRKSINGGQSFFDIPVPNVSGGPTVFIAPFVLAEDNPDVIYAGRDIVYKTTNGGQSWLPTNGNNPLDGNPVFSLAVAPQNNQVAYAATAPFATTPGVHRTVSGGFVWEEVTGNLPNRYPTDLAVDPNDDMTVYITFSGFGTSHVFKSTDAGDNWQDINGNLPDVPANAVIVDPAFSNHVYVGNDIGVYASTDGGQNWHAFSEGLPDAVIAMGLSISPLNRKLRVATHGNGAYQRPLLELPLGIENEETLISEFTLKQNYPNPFNPQTTIPFALKSTAPVTLKIYNTLGQEVRTLLNQVNYASGEHEISWDGLDQRGQKAASGVYLYRITAGSESASRRMMLAR